MSERTSARWISGTRALPWWGIFHLVAIESVVFASLVFSYLYLRAGAAEWPPAGISPPSLALPSANALILFASVIPMWWGVRGIKRGHARRLAYGLIASLVLATVFLALKVVEYSGVEYTWMENAYASIVWTITGFHAGHVVAMILKTAPMAFLAWTGHFDELEHAAIGGAALYWYFVAGVWAPLFATLYLGPRVL